MPCARFSIPVSPLPAWSFSLVCLQGARGSSVLLPVFKRTQVRFGAQVTDTPGIRKSRRRDLQTHHQRAEYHRRNSSTQLMSPPPAAGEKAPEGLVAVLPDFVSLWLGPGSWRSLYD